MLAYLANAGAACPDRPTSILEEHGHDLVGLAAAPQAVAVPVLALAGLDRRAGPGRAADAPCVHRSGLAACIRGLGATSTVPTMRGEWTATSVAGNLYDAYERSDLPAVLMYACSRCSSGLFFGAPLVSREVEQGTHRLVWTQDVTRLRWALVKFGLVAAGTTVVATAYALLTTWWLVPLTHADPNNGRFNFPFFDLYGIAPVGYTLFAVALGIFAGTISRNMLPAMAITLVCSSALGRRGICGARPRFQAPLQRTFPVASDVAPNRSLGDWILSHGIYDGAGTLIASDTIGVCHASEVDVCGGPDRFNVWTYQPGDRFWLFQYLETWLYVFLAAILMLLAVWRVRRRIS